MNENQVNANTDYIESVSDVSFILGTGRVPYLSKKSRSDFECSLLRRCRIENPI